MFGSFEEGGIGLSEADLPEVSVDLYGTVRAGNWSFDLEDETDSDILENVQANLAYWLWRKRNADQIREILENNKERERQINTLSDLGYGRIDAVEMVKLLFDAGYQITAKQL